jgi:SpoVK/Ycf46/Vps4 family AAA+-type ATPase
LEKFSLQKSMREFVLKSIPPENIEKVVTLKEVIATEINEVYKNFNTLYLRKDDGDKLRNILEMFYENNDLMAEMGIPNKLGILLHGIPGTGKSSAIAAIATYLKKNIYCVDFKTIKTNSDFMLVVDYVNKHCIGGGILTFEDFDAMGSVLHKREHKPISDTTVASLHNSINETLTLDYILNVFQGSLTPSGFVFIATTNHLNMLDDALYRDGRFDVKIEMKLCDHYQIQCIYNKLLRRDVPLNILKKIKEDKWTPANIIFRVIHFVKGDHDDAIILQPFLE